VSTPASPVVDERLSAAEAVAGFLAAAAIFVAAITVMNIHFTIEGVSIAFRPIKTGVAAEFVALFAVALGGGRSKLPAAAAAFCSVAWFAAMVVAVVTRRPLF
jgi:hypothetical protein